jgi:hypothetical protein
VARSRLSQVLGAGRALLLLVVAVAPLRAERRPTESQTKRQQRQEAVDALPLEELPQQIRARIAPLIGPQGIHRRLSTEVLRCDPQIYQFLVDEPDVTVAIWRALGISRLELRRLADDQFEVRDRKGLHGRIEFLHRGAGRRLIWFEGDYRNPLTGRPIAATVLVLLRSAAIRETDGHDYVVHRLDAFLKLDSEAAELFLRILEPFTASQANRNFSQIGNFLAVMSALGSRHPQWALKLADRLENVAPEQRRRFRKVVEGLAERSAQPKPPARQRAPTPSRKTRKAKVRATNAAQAADPGTVSNGAG